MISAGNDIVSFAEIIPTRTKQPAFYKKFLTDWEVSQHAELAGSVPSFEVYVWLLWSVKEAAFKFLARLSPQLVFSPTKFVVGAVKVALDSGDFISAGLYNAEPIGITKWEGHITVNETVLPYFSWISAGYIHTVIHHTGNSYKLYWALYQIHGSSPETQSAEVRKLCLDKINSVMPGNCFSIIKSQDGVPSLHNNETMAQYPVSFSHHGYFVGCAFLM